VWSNYWVSNKKSRGMEGLSLIVLSNWGGSWVALEGDDSLGKGVFKTGVYMKIKKAVFLGQLGREYFIRSLGSVLSLSLWRLYELRFNSMNISLNWCRLGQGIDNNALPHRCAIKLKLHNTHSFIYDLFLPCPSFTCLDFVENLCILTILPFNRYLPSMNTNLLGECSILSTPLPRNIWLVTLHSIKVASHHLDIVSYISYSEIFTFLAAPLSRDLSHLFLFLCTFYGAALVAAWSSFEWPSMSSPSKLFNMFEIQCVQKRMLCSIKYPSNPLFIYWK